MELKVLEKGGKIFSHIRQKWLTKTPEEVVRQNYLLQLVNKYSYSIDQIKEEENVTGRASAQARADFIIYKSKEDIAKNNNPLIIVECKAENINITEKEYLQGEIYARIYNAPFFVTHNNKETKFWRVKKDKSPGYREEIKDIPKNNASEKEINKLLTELITFKEGEFKKVLKQCHDIIYQNEKADPVFAFDEIAKILFMKVYAERYLKSGNGDNIFSLRWVEDAEKYTKDFIEKTFEDTKKEFGKGSIFKENEKINLEKQTIKAIIQKLEKYNLSATSADVKGIAFEGFLGDTFRSDNGQFFTPRTIVEFMLEMIAPQENEMVCDPACGSGGFLIRYFQTVRDKILLQIEKEYQQQKQEIEKNKKNSEEEKNSQIFAAFKNAEKLSDITNLDSPIWHLANGFIFGTDANERMARTSKMNMIMHGDGHGGIRHQNGFKNIDDIKEGTFDVVITNPPFGSVVNDISILSNYSLPNKKPIREEFLFIERCLGLLKKGGKLAIVLPESVFNNPSDVFVREFVEDRAKILSIISLPQDTFLQSGASIKCSLLFLKKFAKAEEKEWQFNLEKYKVDALHSQKLEREKINTILEAKLSAKDFPSKNEYQKATDELKEKKKEAQKKLKELDSIVIEEGRKRAKFACDYNIFTAQAELVGYTTTGEITTNQLPDILEDYFNFKKKNQLPALKFNGSNLVSFSQTKRWDVKSFFEKKYTWDIELVKPIAYIGKQFKEQVSKEDVIKNKYSIIKKINFGGELFLRDFDEINKYKGNLFLVPPKSFIFSKINARHGCFYFHKENEKPFVVSGEYPVIQFEETKALGDYVQLALRFGIAKTMLNAKVAGMAKPRVNIDEFFKITIPLPPLRKQTELVKMWIDVIETENQAKAKRAKAITDISKFILGK